MRQLFSQQTHKTQSYWDAAIFYFMKTSVSYSWRAKMRRREGKYIFSDLRSFLNHDVYTQSVVRKRKLIARIRCHPNNGRWSNNHKFLSASHQSSSWYKWIPLVINHSVNMYSIQAHLSSIFKHLSTTTASFLKFCPSALIVS